MLPPPQKNRLAVAPLLPHNCVFHFMQSLILITKVVSPALLSRSTSSAASLTPPPSSMKIPISFSIHGNAPSVITPITGTSLMLCFVPITTKKTRTLGQTSAWYAILSIKSTSGCSALEWVLPPVMNSCCLDDVFLNKVDFGCWFGIVLKMGFALWPLDQSWTLQWYSQLQLVGTCSVHHSVMPRPL